MRKFFTGLGSAFVLVIGIGQAVAEPIHFDFNATLSNAGVGDVFDFNASTNPDAFGGALIFDYFGDAQRPGGGYSLSSGTDIRNQVTNQISGSASYNFAGSASEDFVFGAPPSDFRLRSETVDNPQNSNLNLPISVLGNSFSFNNQGFTNLSGSSSEGLSSGFSSSKLSLTVEAPQGISLTIPTVERQINFSGGCCDDLSTITDITSVETTHTFDLAFIIMDFDFRGIALDDLTPDITDPDVLSLVTMQTITFIFNDRQLAATNPDVFGQVVLNYDIDSITRTAPDTAVVPEPTTLALFSLGLIGMALSTRRKWRVR